ncbi:MULTISPECIES: LysR family transcriptional regulator [unclassified Inquilinus]|uniref:LysR family transcriptional regulator n=1 Tax=unclassified Inquilinus TaxID=2645927 RepID=UPI003F8EA340
MDWDLARFVLAIARHGTASAAAQALAVDQTTVSRRLAAAEAALGTPLFERIEKRFRPTPVGAAVIAQAEVMDRAAIAIQHAARDRDAALSGPVRISILPGFAGWLIPRMGDLRRRHPGLRPTVLSTDINADLERRDADIALRQARPRSGDLAARLGVRIGHAVYGPAVCGPGNGAAEGWIALEPALDAVPQMVWLRDQPGGTDPVLRVTGGPELLAAVRAGLGRAVIPCYLADDAPGLRRLSGPVPVASRELWIVLPAPAKDVPRIRVVADWLAEALTADRVRLEGVQS